jgi:plasmid stability protein
MARKREAKPMPAIEAPSEVKAVRLELTPELHQQLRVVAAQHGQSMASYVRTLVMRELTKPKGGTK